MRSPRGLPDDDGNRQSPRARFKGAHGHAGIDDPEKEQRDLGRVPPPNLELAHVSFALGSASTKNPGSRAA